MGTRNGVKRVDVSERNKSVKQRLAASKGQKGRKHTEEQRAKNSFAHRKENMSKESYDKLVAANRKNALLRKTVTIAERRRKKAGYQNRRRALLVSIGSFHTDTEWETLKAQYNWTCPCCQKSEPTVRLTRDHIIPLSKGGSDNIENIQPLCNFCNSRKFTKIIKYKNLARTEP